MVDLTSAFQLFKPSKEAVWQNSTAVLVIIFLPAFLALVGQVLAGAPTEINANNILKMAGADSTHPLASLGSILALVFLPAGFYLEAMAAKGKTLSVSEALSGGWKYFWRILGLVILVGLIVFAGLLLFIVPGIIFIRRYFLSPYFLINKDLGIREAMKASADATKGKPGAVWGIIGVMFLMGLLNIFPIFGGLISLILMTLYTCAPAIRYLELTKSHAPVAATK